MEASLRDRALCLVAGAALGSAATYLSYSLVTRRPSAAAGLPTAALGSASAAARATATVADFLKDDVLKEQFTRNVQFFGEDGQSRIASAFVVVVGLGVSWLCYTFVFSLGAIYSRRGT